MRNSDLGWRRKPGKLGSKKGRRRRRRRRCKGRCQKLQRGKDEGMPAGLGNLAATWDSRSIG